MDVLWNSVVKMNEAVPSIGIIFGFETKKRAMKIFLTCCIALAFLGCKAKKNSMSEEIHTSANENQTIKITAEIGDPDTESALIDITDVRISGNKLFIDVAYSGGCKDHDFKVIGSAAIQKSLPPIRSIKLIHINNDDNCRAYLMKTLEVDIKALAYQQEKGSVIYLNLDGWKERLTFTFE